MMCNIISNIYNTLSNVDSMRCSKCTYEAICRIPFLEFPGKHILLNLLSLAQHCINSDVIVALN